MIGPTSPEPWGARYPGWNGGTGINVCHVIHDLRPGGAERVFLDLAAVSEAAGMQLSLVSLMPLEDVAFREQLAGFGVQVQSLELGSRWDVRGFARARDIISDHAPDVVHTHLKHADLIGGYAARTLGLPHVSTLHVIETGMPLIGTGKTWLAARGRQRTAARTIAVSDALRNWYIEVTAADPRTVVRIYNGVTRPEQFSGEEIRSLRADLGLDEPRMVISCVGLMRPEKGHSDLLNAIARQRSPDTTYLLAGDGPCRAELEAQAASLGLNADRVRFLGFRDDVDALLAVSDLVVQPSHEDALPTTLIQALAAGLPAVATDVGGIPEIMTPELAQFVPPGDVDELSRALDAGPDRLARQPAVASLARERFESHFEASGWAQRLCETYTDVLGARDTPPACRSG